MNIKLEPQDIIRIKVILMDGDKDDALAFIKEIVKPQLAPSEGLTMKNHLDGGKGSML